MADSKQKLKFDTKYEESPKQIKNREARNKARYDAVVAGKVKKGDKTKDVDHTIPLARGGSTDVKNTKVVSVKKNRGWRKDKKGYMP